MSNQVNDQLADRAYELAQSKYDATAPDEIIKSEAEKIYKAMMEEEFYDTLIKGTIKGIVDYKNKYGHNPPTCFSGANRDYVDPEDLEKLDWQGAEQ